MAYRRSVAFALVFVLTLAAWVLTEGYNGSHAIGSSDLRKRAVALHKSISQNESPSLASLTDVRTATVVSNATTTLTVVSFPQHRPNGKAPTTTATTTPKASSTTEVLGDSYFPLPIPLAACPSGPSIPYAPPYKPRPPSLILSTTAFSVPQCRHPFVVLEVRLPVALSQLRAGCLGLPHMTSITRSQHSLSDDQSQQERPGRAWWWCFAHCASQRCCTAFSVTTSYRRHHADNSQNITMVETCVLRECSPVSVTVDDRIFPQQSSGDEAGTTHHHQLFLMLIKRQLYFCPDCQPQLVVTGLPGSVWRIGDGSEAFSFSIPDAAEASVRNAEGEIVTSASGVLEVKVLVPAKRSHSLETFAAIVDSRLNPTYPVFYDVLLVDGGRVPLRVTLDGIAEWVGCEALLTLTMTPTTTSEIAVGVGHAKSGQERNGEETIQLGVLHWNRTFLIHRHANSVQLQVLLERSDSTETAPLRSVPVVGACGASYLDAATECCFPWVNARHAHTDFDGFDASLPDSQGLVAELRIVPAPYSSHAVVDSPLFSGGRDATGSESVRSSTAVGEDKAVDHEACWRLVDGYYAQFDEQGRVAFPSLILERANAAVCPPRAAASALPLVLQLMVGGRLLPSASIAISAETLRSRCASVFRGATASPQEHQRTPGVAELIPIKNSTATPILISVTVHTSLYALERLLNNIRVFASPCLVVLHVSRTGTLSFSDVAVLVSRFLQSWKDSRRFDVVVNPNSTGALVPPYYLDVTHASNIAFVLAQCPHWQWSHVVWMQWNERIVKRGLHGYLAQYDASAPFTPDIGSGLVRHHTPRNRWYQSAAEVLRNYQGTIPFFGLLRNAHVHAIRSHFAAQKSSMAADGDGRRQQHQAPSRRVPGPPYPSFIHMTEGTFLSRSLAEEVSRLLPTLFDPHNTCESDNIVVHEYAVPILLQELCQRPNIRCGARVSMLLWKRKDFTVAPQDIHFVRCSPNGPPFAMKRFPIDPHHATNKLLDSIEADAALRTLHRSDKTHHECVNARTRIVSDD